MAVSAATLLNSRQASITADGQRRRVHVWQVLTTGLEDDVTVLTAAGLPLWGQPHPTDAGCWVWEVAPREVEKTAEGSKWEITITYSSQPRRTCNDVQETNPLKQRPVIVWLDEKFDEVVEKAYRIDAEGKPSAEPVPILNSANQRFRDPVTRRATKLGLRITRNMATWNPLATQNYVDHVNSSEFQVAGIKFPPRVVRLERWTATPKYHGVCEVYYEHVMEFWIQPAKGDGKAGWDRDLMDVGTAELVDEGDGPKLRLIRDEHNVPITEEVPLDGSGARLPLPLSDENPAAYLTYRVEPEADFNDLKLPQDP
jgi:hypothetical protein